MKFELHKLVHSSVHVDVQSDLVNPHGLVVSVRITEL